MKQYVNKFIIYLRKGNIYMYIAKW